MSWLKIDDQISFHAKTVSAGNAAFGAWVRMAAWSCAQLTDGRIPASIARTMATSRELRDLVSVGFLNRTDGGFEIHGFLDWNPSSVEILEKKSKDAARKAAGRASQERDNLGRVSAANSRGSDQMSARTSAGLPPDSERSPLRRPPVPSPSPSPSPNSEQQNPHNPPLAEPAPASRSVAVAPAISGQQSGSEDAERAEDAERSAATGPRSLFGGLDVGSEGSGAKSSTTAPKRRAASACPGSDASDDDLAAWATRWKLDPAHPEFAQWLDHHRAKRSLFADWAAAWRTWQRNAAKWSRGAPATAAFRPGIQPPAASGQEYWTPGDGKGWLDDVEAENA